MNTFRFANTNWIHAVWIVLAIGVLLVVLELRGRHILERFVSRALQPQLARRPSLTRRLGAIVLAVLALLLLVLAMMRPQWGMTVQHIARIGSQVMVCLDVSKSMLAEDVAPNRLDRAKVELDSLLGLMDKDQQVGLIAFAGKATVLCPMTTDFGFLRLVLNEAGPDSVGRGGTKIGAAIRKAVAGFRMAGDMNRVILLITDGEDHDSMPLDAAKKAKEKGIKIVCIGFGDEAGSKIEITDPKTGMRSFVKDANGKDVISRLDGELLRKIALATDGAFVPAGTGALDLASIYHKHIATLLAGSATQQQRIIHNEIYQWFVIAAICFLVMSLLTASAPTLKRWGLDVAADAAAGSAVERAGKAAIMLTVLAGMPLATSQAAARAAPAPGASSATASATPSNATAANATTHSNSPPARSSASGGESRESLAPRTAYNRALALLSTDADRAEKLLNQARRDAGSDGELRYRTLYNLGWLEARRADNVLRQEPKKALQHLQQAANRFREAIRIRADSTSARQNLEIISRRILELTDTLHKKNAGDFAARLDALIQRIRQQQGLLGDLVQRTATIKDAAQIESFRAKFRHEAVSQREMIAAMGRFADDAREVQDALNKKPKDKQTPQDKLKAVQLANMLQFIDRCLQRMTMARSLTRRLQGTRAFRRWSMALAEAKHARDQLRNPVEVIGQLLAEAGDLVTQTRRLAAGAAIGVKPQPPNASTTVPAWLTRDYLQDLQQSISARTNELAQLLQRIAARQSGKAKMKPAMAQQPAAANPQTKRLLDNIRAAAPLVAAAGTQLTRAGKDLQDHALAAANDKQLDAIRSLSKAWELFFDIRRLIEVIYRDERLVKQALDQAVDQPDVVPQLTKAITTTQQRNLARCRRLGGMLASRADQLAKSPAATAGSKGKKPQDAEQRAAQKQRLQLAKGLLGQVVADIEHANTALDNVGRSLKARAAIALDQPTLKPSSPPDAGAKAKPQTKPAAKTKAKTKPPAVSKKKTEHIADNQNARHEARPPAKKSDAARSNAVKPHAAAANSTNSASAKTKTGTRKNPLAPVTAPVDDAVEKLEQLRRLFFSLIEHLRDTARRQANLNDATAQLSGQPAADITSTRVGPLSDRQEQIRQVTGQISAALKKQRAQTPASGQSKVASKADHASVPGGAANAEKLGQAADLLDAAQDDMRGAIDHLNNAPKTATAKKTPLKPAMQSQAAALKKLLDAIALLDQNHKQQQNQQQQPQQQQNQQTQRQNQKKQNQQQNLSAAQLLQLIRDREAQRRKDRRHATTHQAPVTKDW